jgi:hypothetical protein
VKTIWLPSSTQPFCLILGFIRLKAANLSPSTALSISYLNNGPYRKYSLDRFPTDTGPLPYGHWTAFLRTLDRFPMDTGPLSYTLDRFPTDNGPLFYGQYTTFLRTLPLSYGHCTTFLRTLDHFPTDTAPLSYGHWTTFLRILGHLARTFYKPITKQ